MIRKGREYKPEEILPLIDFSIPFEDNEFLAKRTELDGDLINFGTSTLQTFAAKGIVCVSCGLIGEYFVKEKVKTDDPYFHLRLYGVKRGHEILFTKDHIKRKRHGGKTKLSNLQTMCQPCNNIKNDFNPPAAKVEIAPFFLHLIKPKFSPQYQGVAA